MSYHIPTEAQENRALAECEQVHRALDARDNPYEMVVVFEHILAWPPPPVLEGQTLLWERRDRKHGPIIRHDFLKAVWWNGQLGWALCDYQYRWP